jgi:hypothetical protein
VGSGSTKVHDRGFSPDFGHWVAAFERGTLRQFLNSHRLSRKSSTPFSRDTVATLLRSQNLEHDGRFGMNAAHSSSPLSAAIDPRRAPAF